MSHNVEIQNGGSGPQTVFTFADGSVGGIGEIRFQRVDSTSLLPRLVVYGNATILQGEDLFAFRELLNELPESAFVRPAEPKSFWSVGDVVAYDGQTLHSIFERKADGWHRISSSESEHSLGLRPVFDDIGVRSWVENPTSGCTVLRRVNA